MQLISESSVEYILEKLERTTGSLSSTPGNNVCFILSVQTVPQSATLVLQSLLNRLRFGHAYGTLVPCAIND
jgi:hypothetical protein